MLSVSAVQLYSDYCTYPSVKFFKFTKCYMHIFPLEDKSKKRDLSSVKHECLVGVQGPLFTQSLSNLKEVRRLDSLVQAHTLLAVMADKTSPEHQLNLLRAYTFVLQIWQVLLIYYIMLSLNLVSVDESVFANARYFCGEYGSCIFVRCLSLQVSMAVGCEISNEVAKSHPPQPPPSAGSKKGKDKGKGKNVKDVIPIVQI